MAEYIDIDAPIDVAVYQRNRRIQVTLRQILESNDAKYERADVRPVVTCGECKHWETDWKPRGASDGIHYCMMVDLCPSADWFCADGEKREESE